MGSLLLLVLPSLVPRVAREREMSLDHSTAWRDDVAIAVEIYQA